MGVGAKDRIDRLLVEKYAGQQVDNHDDDALESKVDAEDMLTAMNMSANHFRNMLELNARLTMACYGVNAKSARYVPIEEDAA